MIITKEVLDKERSELNKQRTQLVAQINAVDGALQELLRLFDMLDKEE